MNVVIAEISKGNMMEPLYPILFMSSVWYWIAVIIASSIIISVLEVAENELYAQRVMPATVVLVLSLILLSGFGSPSLLNLLIKTPIWTVILFSVVYLFIGTNYSLLRWVHFCKKQLKLYQTIKQKILEKLGINSSEIPSESKEVFKEELASYFKNSYNCKLQYHRVKNDLIIGPVPSENIDRIASWMLYWPWSLIWFLFNDLVVAIFRKIATITHNLMNGITRKIFKEVDKDLI